MVAVFLKSIHLLQTPILINQKTTALKPFPYFFISTDKSKLSSISGKVTFSITTGSASKFRILLLFTVKFRKQLKIVLHHDEHPAKKV